MIDCNLWQKGTCMNTRIRALAVILAEVYRTVIHEIAHHFGIGDGVLRALGW